jgi:hypothetical protein
MHKIIKSRDLNNYLKPMFIVALFKIAKYICSEILTHATTWMNLEDIMLSEMSQSQKKTVLYFSTYIRTP